MRLGESTQQYVPVHDEAISVNPAGTPLSIMYGGPQAQMHVVPSVAQT